MPRKYEKVQELLPVVKQLAESGWTQRQIAEELGLSGKEVVKGVLKRERQKENKITQEQSTKLVLDTVRAAKGKEKVTAELQLHSDQGFQYTSQAYFKLTQRYGITPSMSRRGNPYDNALAENFFSILKTECIYRTKIATLAEAKKLMDDYIFFYNNQRIQSKTKLTPLELRRQYLA